MANPNVSSKVDEAADKARRTAAQAEFAAQDATHAVRDVAHNFGNALDDSLQKQPMTTLAMAVGVGFILGALWKA